VTTEQTAFEGWMVLEIMGHRRLGGYVREQTVAGAGFLRIDVPGPDGVDATQFYPPSSVYCMTPCSEEAARAVARANRVEPVARWELPAPADNPHITQADLRRLDDQGLGRRDDQGLGRRDTTIYGGLDPDDEEAPDPDY
jgi:hypothetical protein